MTRTVAAAYGASASAWHDGPGRLYERLAWVVVGRVAEHVDDARVVDIGAGTGAASRAALDCGARQVVAVDVAPAMLAHQGAGRPAAVTADVRALPFAPGSFDVSIAAFTLNHLDDPAAGLQEMARVTRAGGTIVASTYAVDDSHPVKAAVDAVLAERGWRPDPWYVALRDRAAPRLATRDAFLAVGDAAGLAGTVEAISVSFVDLDARALVAWRLGMAQHAPFVATLERDEHAAVVSAALERLGGSVPPLRRSILAFIARC